MNFNIEVNDVSLKYDQFEALTNITFNLAGGKIYGILGRNGAGKTSLLSLLASFREPQEGSIKIAGEMPFENPDIMQNVAFIYEKDYKDESEKVKGMLEFSERYRPYYDKEYAKHLIERFKLPLDKEIKQLSKGMQSALNVTIGLASRTPITIFDEAYLGMDAPTREIFYQELLEDQSNHPRTILLSTHLVSEMEYLFEEVLIIDHGSIILQDDYESLVSKGASITGAADEVDAFVNGTQMEKLSEQRLGNTKSIMLYGELTEKQKMEARKMGLEISAMTLQELFIHLTKEDH